MAFRAGQYDFVVWPACLEKFESIVPELQTQGASREAFIRVLRKVRAEVQLGRQSADLFSSDIENEYAINVFGFEVQLEIDQLSMTITIMDIEDEAI